MRTVFLLSLTAVVAVAAGCGSASTPRRDLTLVTHASAPEIASPVETERPVIQHRSVRPSQRARAPRASRAPKVKLADVRVPTPVLVIPQPVARPSGAAATPADDRELLPGKTVTLIPASSGPSIDSDRTNELSEARGQTKRARGKGRHGGGCR
jgi:hypothetical protein